MTLRLCSIVFSLLLLLGAATSPVQAHPSLQAAPVTVTVAENANLRAGPGTSFARVGGIAGGATVQVTGCNADCTWFQTPTGAWIAAELLVDPPALPPASSASVSAPTPAPLSSLPLSPVPAPDAADLAITSLTDARQAIVHIETLGTFLPLGETDTVFEAWEGTGFIIDPSGIVVTNAHVVNGGEGFLVYLDGEAKPQYATVLGISECSDLALLDIRGSGYPYLLWADTAPQVGQSIQAIGYPSGRYRSSTGLIEETYAAGDTAWAAVESVIRHTAFTAPGSSGGPILDQRGRVVGINFAGNTSNGTSSAISWEAAVPVVATLAGGSNLDSIGINGEAFLIEEDEEELFGIWVVSVESGSPAAALGVQPADILLGLEEIPVGIGGNFGSYCTVLRSHAPDARMDVVLVRLSTQEFLCGQINGSPLVNCDELAATGAPSASGAPDAPQQSAPGAYDNGIYLPTSGSTLSGNVAIQGVAVHPAFSKWQLDLLVDGAKETFLASGTSAVPAPGELLVLNTSLYPNGNHILRLRVVKRDGNYDEYSLPVSIQN